MQNPSVIIRNLIADNWEPSNTDYPNVPAIVTGWYENDDFNVPHVCILNFSNPSQDGGDTGFRGQSSAGNPMRRILGEGFLLSMDHTGTDSTVNPKDLVWQMTMEIKRIVQNNIHDPPEPFNWMNYISENDPGPDSTRRPIIHRQECVIRYSYDDRVILNAT